MNILIVNAHENLNSFCTSLAKTGKQYFETQGHRVTISDLYQKGFNPVAGKHDFNNPTDASYYKYAAEQLHANNSNSFSKELKEEMHLLKNADVLILNFPLWWLGLPAILKGWVDRVLAYGFAYGGDYGFYKDGRFNGKKALLSITTGSPASFYTVDGAHGRSLENILRNINEGVLGLIGFEVLAPFIGYSVSHISEGERKEIIKNYSEFLAQNFGDNF